MDLPPPNDLLPRPLRRALAPPLRFLFSAVSRYVFAWLVALAVAGGFAHRAWNAFNGTERGDGNDGHTTIDFGGQWLMGRMLVEGHGRHLYDRNYQRAVLVGNFPVADEDPAQKRSDVENLMVAMMGSDSRPAQTVASFLTPLAAPDAPAALALLTAGRTHWTADRLEEIPAKRVGGPLYPPVHALLFSPLALLEPHAAYRLTQALNLVLAFAAGLAVSRLSQGRVWWPVAAVLIMGFPGFAGSLNLGQNATLSLAVLLWGWVLIAAGRPGWGGALWGLLAFKPIWAVPFFLALALTRRWRACLAMLAAGAALALATLPLVGVEGWLDWLEIGRSAVPIYDYDENWIFLGRDVLGLPRRWLLDFKLPRDERIQEPWSPVLGRGLLGMIALLTAALALWRGRQAGAPAGVPAAFVFLAAWLGGFHFMYYDALLAAFPMMLLIAAVPRDYFRARFAALPRDDPGRADGLPAWTFRVTNVTVGVALILVLVGIQFVVAVVKWGSLRDPPWDTLFLLLVWLGCGLVWLRVPARLARAGGTLLAPAWEFLRRPRPRYALAWLFALGVSGTLAHWAWIYLNEPERADGNSGHYSIDFGGQWLMGRMILEGHGRHLYDRNHQRAVLLGHLPVSDQDPQAKQSDVESLMAAFMGEDDPARPRVLAAFLAPLAAADAPAAIALLAATQDYATAERLDGLAAKRVGGPLYPPVNALLTVPLALIEPRPAYRAGQALNLVLAFVGGLAVCRLTRGRVWWPVASALLVVYPGFAGSLNLGQNAALSLAFVLWGWVLMSEGRPAWGGFLWGLLAYKPVWALSFCFALVLTRRWRACLAMLATGAALALATLPLVGVDSWFDWLKIGQEAADRYNVGRHWIHLSRDLLGIPRRWLLDFTIEPARDRDTSWLAPVLGWGMLGTVAVLTAALALRRRDQAQAPAGAPAAFVLLGAWLCCYHFMYYDVLLTALPLFLLTAVPPRDYFRVGLFFPGTGAAEADANALPRGGVTLAVSNRRIGLGLVAVLVGIQLVAVYEQWGHAYGTPFDTFFLMLVWLGCGWVWLRTPARAPQERPAKTAEPALQPSPC